MSKGTPSSSLQTDPLPGARSGSYAKKSTDTGEQIDAAWCDHEID